MWLTTYGILWIYEGALRKWVLPGAADVIYLVRDASTVVTFLAVLILGTGRRPSRTFAAAIVVAFGLAVLSILQLIVSGGITRVAVVGSVGYISPLLAAGLAALVGDPRRVLDSLLRIILWSAPIQAGLAILQVVTPPSGFWNRVGTEEAALFTADGIVRASGSFTSPTGLTCFTTLLAALTLGRLYDEGRRSGRGLTGMAVVSSGVLLSIGGSRGALLVAAALFVAALMLTFGRADRLGRSLVRTTAIIAASLALYFLSRAALPAVTEAFSARLTNASENEDTVGRVIVTSFGYLSLPYDLLGAGAGNHTNAGVALGAEGPWIENELERWVAELGLAGLLAGVGRQLLSVVGLVYALRASIRSGYTRPYFVIAALSTTLIAGSGFSQPSQQGMTALMLAIVLLSYRELSDRNGQPTND